MTSYILLSSNTIPFNTTYPVLSLVDVSTIYVNLSSIDSSIIPKLLHINWGDGTIDEYENDVFKGNIYENNYAEVFKIYEHSYYPSSTSKNIELSATFKITYLNNQISTFVIPLKIENDSYENVIEDIFLINTIFYKNYKIHQFVTKKDGYLIELKTSN
jgi:hypothetical protein